MSALEQLVAGVRVRGIDPTGTVEVVAVAWHGTAAITLTYRDSQRNLQERVLFRFDEATFALADGDVRRWDFGADGHLFRLAAEARRIELAHLFDPYIALTRAGSSRCRTRSRRCSARCCHASRCASCSPTTRAPARRSWPGCTSRS